MQARKLIQSGFFLSSQQLDNLYLQKQVITSFLERLLSQDTLVLTEISLERCDIMAEKSTSQFPLSDFASTFLLKKDSFQSESAKEYC